MNKLKTILTTLLMIPAFAYTLAQDVKEIPKTPQKAGDDKTWVTKFEPKRMKVEVNTAYGDTTVDVYKGSRLFRGHQFGYMNRGVVGSRYYGFRDKDTSERKAHPVSTVIVCDRDRSTIFDRNADFFSKDTTKTIGLQNLMDRLFLTADTSYRSEIKGAYKTEGYEGTPSPETLRLRKEMKRLSRQLFEEYLKNDQVFFKYKR